MVVIVVIFVADQLVCSSVGIVTDLGGTWTLQIVDAFFGTSRQDIVVSSVCVMDNVKGEKEILASAGRTVDVAALLDKGGVGMSSFPLLSAQLAAGLRAIPQCRQISSKSWHDMT